MFYNPYGSLFGTVSSISTVIVVCAVLGLILGIVLLFVFLPAKNRGKYQGAAKWFYDFLNFHKYWITSLIKVINIVIAVVCLLGGFICLFIQPLVGLGLIIGYVLYRMLLEIIMVTLNIRDNVSSIDDKLSRMGLPGGSPEIGNAPDAMGFAPAAPKVCPNCGSPVDPGTKFCMRCGRPV